MPVSVTPARRRLPRRLPDVLYGLYAWAVFLVCVLFAVLAVTFVPGLERRQRLVALAARSSFLLAGIRPEVEGYANLPDGACVVVANHASYLDGILLAGFLPARFSFVIKGEMRNVPVLHFLLRRAGSRFVERFSTAESSRDARRIVRAAKDGTSLGLFPEGTFRREPGIGEFRAGAFVAASRGGLPVVPVAISGTRDVLPSGRRLPRHGPVRIEILPAIAPEAAAARDNRWLAEAARQRILRATGEPDLLAASPDLCCTAAKNAGQ